MTRNKRLEKKIGICCLNLWFGCDSFYVPDRVIADCVVVVVVDVVDGADSTTSATGNMNTVGVVNWLVEPAIGIMVAIVSPDDSFVFDVSNVLPGNSVE